MSVSVSVTEVHWRIIANLDFKFRSQFTAHWEGIIAGKSGGIISRLLATARPSYLIISNGTLRKLIYLDKRCFGCFRLELYPKLVEYNVNMQWADYGQPFVHHMTVHLCVQQDGRKAVYRAGPSVV